MTMKNTAWTVLLVALLSACQSAGKPWAKLAETDDPLTTLSQIFSVRVTESGHRLPDKDVVKINDDEIVFKDEKGDLRRLKFADIALVDMDLPDLRQREQESLRLYLVKDSESVKTALAKDSPFGIGRPFVFLDARPLGSQQRVRQSLARLAQKRPRETPEPAPKQQPAPKTEGPSKAKTEPSRRDEQSIERRLRKLKQWYDEGLIEKAEYDTKRADLLKDY